MACLGENVVNFFVLSSASPFSVLVAGLATHSCQCLIFFFFFKVANPNAYKKTRVKVKEK